MYATVLALLRDTANPLDPARSIHMTKENDRDRH